MGLYNFKKDKLIFSQIFSRLALKIMITPYHQPSSSARYKLVFSSQLTGNGDRKFCIRRTVISNVIGSPLKGLLSSPEDTADASLT